VALEGEAKERYNAIQQQLAQLSTKFSNNVLDATKVGGHMRRKNAVPHLPQITVRTFVEVAYDPREQCNSCLLLR
jgi:oligopeptidase A